MVSAQARLVALLALCLFASTVGSLPSNKPRADVPNAGSVPVFSPSLFKDIAVPGGTEHHDHTHTNPPSEEKKTTTPPAPQNAQNAPQARRSPQNDHVRLGKRGYPGHAHRSSSRRNRPNNRYSKHHRHGHAKTYDRKPVSHSPYKRNKYSDGFSTRF